MTRKEVADSKNKLHDTMIIEVSGARPDPDRYHQILLRNNYCSFMAIENILNAIGVEELERKERLEAALIFVIRELKGQDVAEELVLQMEEKPAAVTAMINDLPLTTDQVDVLIDGIKNLGFTSNDEHPESLPRISEAPNEQPTDPGGSSTGEAT